LEIIQEFRKSDTEAYLFDPREAVVGHHADRRIGRNSKPTPSVKTRKVAKPGSKHGRRYSRAS
jgi:hypothetical protein